MMSDDRYTSEDPLNILISTSLVGLLRDLWNLLYKLKDYGSLLEWIFEGLKGRMRSRVTLLTLRRTARAQKSLLFSHVWPNCQDVRDCGGGIFHFSLDSRDCSISSNLSPLFARANSWTSRNDNYPQKLDCGEQQSKIAKTLPIILQKYRCQLAEVRFIYFSILENVISKFTRSFIRILVADKMV